MNSYHRYHSTEEEKEEDEEDEEEDEEQIWNTPEMIRRTAAPGKLFGRMYLSHYLLI